MGEGKHSCIICSFLFIFGSARAAPSLDVRRPVLTCTGSSRHVHRHPATQQAVSFTGQHIVGRDPADH